MSKVKPLKRKLTLGVSLIEASLALPIVILGSLLIVDLCRYGLTKMMLNYSAFQAADLASKSTFEVDTYDCSTETARSTCARYLTTFYATGDHALVTANLVAGSSNSSKMVKLRRFEHYFSSAQSHLRNVNPRGNGAQIFQDIAILRPGEKVRRDLDALEINHSTWPYGATDSSNSGWPRSVNTWPKLLDSNPIQVRIEAEFAFFTPLIPPVLIVATQDAWRRTRAFGVPVAPGAVATIPPYPTQTPVPPTPTNDPLVSPTATGTRTPIPPTPTVSEFCRNNCRRDHCNPVLCFPDPPQGCGGCRYGRGD